MKSLGNYLLLAASLCISLILCEIVIRVIESKKYSQIATGSQYAFYQFDEVLGWSNAPLTRGVFKRDEYEIKVNINSYGMRDKEITKNPPRDTFRVAFLGDSHVWGFGVSDEQRFTDIVGSLPGIESLNFGVSGYAPVQYLLMIDKVISFKPSLVVIAMCGNDYTDNVHYQRYGYYKPYYVLNNNQIELKGYPLKNVKKFGSAITNSLTNRIRTIALLKSCINNIRSLALFKTHVKNGVTASGQQGLINFKDIYSYSTPNENDRKTFDTAVLINNKILEQIKMKLDAAGIPLAIVTSPSKFEYNPKGTFGNITTSHLLSTLLRTETEKMHVDFIDTVPLLNGNDFWVHDGHWNLQGHRKMASAIKDYLKKYNLIGH
jgi:lysophospholipase L1-like esterase